MKKKNLNEAELLRKAKEYLIPPMLVRPIFVRGQGAVVEDMDGREYIDCASGPGVLNIGHCHPKVVAVGQEQIAMMSQGPGRHYSVALIEMAEKLASIAPGDLKRSYFGNSGAEANDNAMKLALRYVTKRGQGTGIVALQRAFHGRLALAVSLSGDIKFKKGFGPYACFPGVIHIPAPFCYRCPMSYPDCDIYCAQALEDAIKSSAQTEVSIFIAEPILGVGGAIVPPDEYFHRIKEICRRYEILIIFDEIFAGLGRTGKMFSCEHFGVVPDIMSVGKSIGGGLPMSAVITNDAIADSLKPGEVNSTFGGNCAATLATGLASINVIQEENLVAHARELGDYTLGGLRDLMGRSRIIGDVRGKGFMIGVEFVTDKKKKTPAPDLAARIRDRLMEEGVIVHTSGLEGCVIRVTPALVITKAQIDEVLKKMGQVVSEVEKAAA